MRTAALFGALLLALGGCGNYTRPVVPAEPQTAEARDFEAIWQASRDVLREYRFELTRRDRRAGVLATGRTTGEHWFEVWRHDAATPRALVESTIQTIYRQVVVRIRPAPNGTFEPDVEVRTYRSSLAQPQITSTSEAFSMFILPGNDQARSIYLLNFGRDETGPNVVPLGRDAALEAKIAADIRAAAERRTLHGPADPADDLPPAPRSES